MKYLPRFLTACALAAACSFTSAVHACIPSALIGRTLTFTIQRGTGIFARNGSFLLTTPRSGLSYIIKPLRGSTPATRGTLIYSQTSDTTASIDFSDSGVKGFPYTGTFDVFEFTSPGAGVFSRFATSGADGEQSGTFTITTTKEDFNHDTQTDILWEDTLGHLDLWQMNGANFGRGVSLDGLYDDNAGRTRDGAWRVVGQEDFDHNGSTDLLWQNRDDGSAKIWYLNGTNFIAEESLDFLSLPDTTWHIVGLADFDNDCELDMVLQSTDGHVQIIPNFLQSSFDQGISFRNGTSLDTRWQIVGVNDFNNDGKPDILWRHKDGTVSLWRMDGLTFSRSVVLPSVPKNPNWNIVGLADFDHNGQMDLLVRRDTGSVCIWKMRGSQFIGVSKVQNGVPIHLGWHIVGPK